MRQLVAQGYLDVDPEGFGTLRLTERCRALLRGEEKISLRREKISVPIAAASSKRRHQDIEPADRELWQALRACRKRLAEEHGVPPYVIFSDATLRDMLEQRPTTSSAMLSVSGVGDVKLERFGGEFLEVIREFEYPV
jgi:ATP-dependent DNA helicase RecQ